MKIIIVCLLTFCLASPALAWRPYCGPYSYAPRCSYGYGHGTAAGAGAAVLLVGLVCLVGGVLIAKAISGGNQAERAMLESAERANQYENFLIAISAYNSISNNRVFPPSKEEWMRWRASQGLPVVR
jgi:hypothetical protein